MALSRTEIEQTLAKLKFWPGWKLEVYDTEAQGTWLAVTASVDDAYNPDAKTVLRIKSQLPPFQTVTDLLRWLRWRLEVIAVHEVHEGLQWQATGRPIFDPHAEGADEPARMFEVTVPTPANTYTFPLPVPGWYGAGRHEAPTRPFKDDGVQSGEPDWQYRHPALDGMERRA